MLLSMAFLTVLAILSVNLSVTSSERLPGLQMRMSKKGLDYANSIALDALTKQLSGLSIPDQSGKSKNIEYTLSGITERGVTMPSSSMTFDRSRNGLNWAVSGLGIKLHASHWRIKYKKGWFKVSTSGSVDLDIRRASLRVTVSLAQRDGRPRVSLSQCHATIDKVHVDFHGGTAFILNLFRGIIGRKIKDLMQTEICKVAVKLVNNDANEMLAMLKVHVKLGPNFLLDYGLVSPPTVDAYGLELKTKGEIYWKSALKGAPFTPKPIPDLAEDSNMLYLWLTDYLANTAIYQASTNGFLRYNLTSSDYPAAKQSFMETTCELFCVGNLIPLIGMVHPNSKVEAAVNAIGAPTLSMTSQGISLNGELIIDLRVVTPEMKTHDVMSFTMELYLSVTGSVRYERLAGEIIDYRLEVKQIESVIGEVDPEILNSMLKVALDLGVIPNLNALMRQGMDLPVTDVFSFKDTQLILQDGSVLIATDITTLTSSRPTQEEIMQHEMSQKKEKQEQLMVELGHLKQEKREQQENEIQPEEASQTTPKREQETPTPSQTTDHPQTEKLTVTDKPKAQTEQTDMTNNPSTSEELRTTEQPQGNDEESNAPQEKEQPKTKPDNNNAFCSHVIEFCHSSIKYCT